jgi:DNA-binding transcriptional LysR family regulator
VSRNRGASEGLLRVSAPRALGDADVSPVRRDLVRAYPRSRPNSSNRSFAELIDVVVRISTLRHSDLVVRKLAGNCRIVVRRARLSRKPWNAFPVES